MRPILIDKGLDIRCQNKESTNNRKIDNDQIYQTFVDKASARPTDWTNPNKENWRSITVGRFFSKSGAKQTVSKRKSRAISDAYSGH